MRRFVTSSCLVVSSLIFAGFLAGCAESLNQQFPDASEHLAEEASVAYPEYETVYSQKMEGTFTSGSDNVIYYFKTDEKETSYTIEWSTTNGNSMVSVSSEATFGQWQKIYFEDDSSGSHVISPSASKTIYIKIHPYNNSSYYCGTYSLQVYGKASKINLKYYSSSIGTSGTEDTTETTETSQITTGAEIPDSWWKTGRITSYSSNMYYFYASYGHTYTVYWDDSYQGSGDYAADIAVTAADDSSFYDTYFYYADSAYTTGKTISPDSSGYIYLKVQAYDSKDGTFRIAVVKDGESQVNLYSY